jgi:hypothetical protein
MYLHLTDFKPDCYFGEGQGLVGEPVFGIATADVVNLFGQVIPSFADDAKDGASELFGLVESRSVGHPASVLPEMTDGPV